MYKLNEFHIQYFVFVILHFRGMVVSYYTHCFLVAYIRVFWLLTHRKVNVWFNTIIRLINTNLWVFIYLCLGFEFSYVYQIENHKGVLEIEYKYKSLAKHLTEHCHWLMCVYQTFAHTMVANPNKIYKSTNFLL